MSAGGAFSQHPILFGVLATLALMFIAGAIVVGINTIWEAVA